MDIITDRATIKQVIWRLDKFTSNSIDEILGGYIAEKMIQDGNTFVITPYTHHKYAVITINLDEKHGFHWVVLEEWLDEAPVGFKAEWGTRFEGLATA